jgi:hypothetical protein
MRAPEFEAPQILILALSYDFWKNEQTCGNRFLVTPSFLCSPEVTNLYPPGMPGINGTSTLGPGLIGCRGTLHLLINWCWSMIVVIGFEEGMNHLATSNLPFRGEKRCCLRWCIYSRATACATALRLNNLEAPDLPRYYHLKAGSEAGFHVVPAVHGDGKPLCGRKMT